MGEDKYAEWYSQWEKTLLWFYATHGRLKKAKQITAIVSIWKELWRLTEWIRSNQLQCPKYYGLKGLSFKILQHIQSNGITNGKWIWAHKTTKHMLQCHWPNSEPSPEKTENKCRKDKTTAHITQWTMKQAHISCLKNSLLHVLWQPITSHRTSIYT